MMSLSSKKQVEAAIQKHIVLYVRDTYPLVKIHATQNEHSYNKNTDGDLGITDLILFRRKGKTLHIFFLELKTTVGTLLASQKKWKKDYDKDFAANNTTYGVAYGYTAAKDAIDSWISLCLSGAS